MSSTEFSRQYRQKMFPGQMSPFQVTDPEFADLFDNFAFDEVVNQPGQELDERTRFMAILATLLGCQAHGVFRTMAEAALNFGVTPVELKEIVYQATPYLGMGRVSPFLRTVNEVLRARGVKFPLEPQATVTPETRREAGSELQAELFGEEMRDSWRSGREETRHINYWLAANCFGDYYTRGGLDLRQREMLTFCFLSAQGGCEPQLTSHAAANLRLGNDRAFLIKVISQCLPYIGYPRSLNALRCVNNACKQQ